MNFKTIGKLLGLGMALVLLAVGGQGGTGFGQDQPPCTVTLTPDQSIQEAIDRASPGDVICLSEGVWVENLTIEKSLTLRGIGMNNTVIKGKEEGKPVIYIESDQEIQVTIEGLTIAEARLVKPRTHNEDGIRIGGKAKVQVRNSLISGNHDDGIEMWGSSQATIYGSFFSENWSDGIEMRDSSQATISNSSFSGNDEGILMKSFSQATISRSSFSGNEEGIWVEDSSQTTVFDSSFSNNEVGIMMWDSSKATIRESCFIDNERCGIWVRSEEVAVSGGPTEMKDNGADLCGFAPASLRKPLVPQTEETELSVPGDYATIQEAIDAIAPGGTIAVAPGTYEVGLTIWKPLTLRGSGKDQTVLKPLPNPTRRLIISIVSEAEEVTLEGMEISGSKEEGLLIYGEAYLKDLQISGNGWDSILMGGFSQATISGSSFSENGYEGIDMWDSSQAAISGSSFFGNGGDGIRMKGSSRAIIFGSSFSRNFSGILMWESSQAIISDSSFSGNNDGIDMRDSSQATIFGSSFSENQIGIWMLDSSKATVSGSSFSGNNCGIWMLDSSKATISDSSFSGNNDGIDMRDSSQATIFNSSFSENVNGIVMKGLSEAKIRRNRIFENEGYGVELFQQPCFNIFMFIEFEGKVEGSGNEIRDNGEGDVCPPELQFLMTEEGGCYGPKCQRR